MYENQTETVILKRMLDSVPADMDKREGSVIYDASMPAAIEFMLMYATMDWFIKNTFGDTAEREYLIEIAKERGLSPYKSTYAEGKAEMLPETVSVAIGSRFSYDDVNYIVTEKLEDGKYLLRCETAGIVGNKPAGKLVPIPYIQGLREARFIEVTVPGEEEEETEKFRERYLSNFDSQAFGGNITDYQQKVNAIAGVGGVKVYPVWDGGGTVKIVFMTSEFKPPTQDFIDRVQTLIDPIQNHGEGLGIAPIGHTVTVTGAKNSAIQINFNITFTTGDFEDYRNAIAAIIDDYFTELNSKWQSTQQISSEQYRNGGIVVRISQIESRVLELSSVIDVQHTELNGVEENLTLGSDELAVRGEIYG